MKYLIAILSLIALSAHGQNSWELKPLTVGPQLIYKPAPSDGIGVHVQPIRRQNFQLPPVTNGWDGQPNLSNQYHRDVYHGRVRKLNGYGKGSEYYGSENED